MRIITAKEPLTREELFEAMKQFVIRGGVRNGVEPNLILIPQAWLSTFKDHDQWPNAVEWTKLPVGGVFQLAGCTAIVVAGNDFHIGFIENLETLLERPMGYLRP